jgi:hypothetical protein
MTRRSLFVALAALALTAWIGSVAVAEGKLVMTDKDGKEHSHDVGPAAQVSIDGKEAKLTDLKKGDKITVTMGADKKVTKIECKRA